MPTIKQLPEAEKLHWQLHLNAALADTPSLNVEIKGYLKNVQLPDIKHPSYIHDWLEHPEWRTEIEAQNG